MTLFEAIMLGIVQGLTEFLPISSTAHLKIVPALLGWSDPGAAFTAIIQIGTLAAVLMYFWRDIITIVSAVMKGILKGKPLESNEARMGWMIAAGTIPIVVFGLLFKDQIETTLRSLYWISGALIGLALLLSLAEWNIKKHLSGGRPLKTMEQIGWKEALLIGLAQSIALIPGSSRSGSPSPEALFEPFKRNSGPVLISALPACRLCCRNFPALQNLDIITASPGNIMNLAAATFTSAVVGYLSIAFLLSYLKKHTTTIFIIYRLLAGILLLLLLSTGTLLP